MAYHTQGHYKLTENWYKEVKGNYSIYEGTLKPQNGWKFAIYKNSVQINEYTIKYNFYLACGGLKYPFPPQYDAWTLVTKKKKKNGTITRFGSEFIPYYSSIKDDYKQYI